MNLTDVLKPNDTIGVIGGGQLGKMIVQSAKRMGFRAGILDPAADCPAAQVADWHIEAAYDDEEALIRLAGKSDAVTFEFENIDDLALKSISAHTRLPQGTEILSITQDRLKEKDFLANKAGVAIAPYVPVREETDLEAALEKIGFPSVLKTVRFGYDGKGQRVLKSQEDVEAARALVKDQVCVLEGWVPFVKELSVMIVRNEAGESAVFPAAENIHVQNILHETIVPARVADEVRKKAVELAKQIAEALQLTGTLGIEMFLTKDNTLYINELAPRPHNSGHYTIEAANFSQFDVHVQAIAGLPMPKVRLLSPTVMVNILGEHLDGSISLRECKPDWAFHFYGKAVSRPGRKMGHITILTDDLEQTLAEVERTRVWKREDPQENSGGQKE